MAYNDTPLSTDLISDSQPDIRENFQLLESAQVVDEGSTSDGDYIRYENGWQICISPLFNVDIDIEVGTNAYRSVRTTWTFPVSFIDDNYYSNAHIYDNVYRWANSENASSTDCDLAGLFFESTTDVNIQAIAIGRWE